jgi:hypothetical protein
VQQRPEDLSGDYEYDLAHEATGGGGPPPARRPEERAPARRQVELDQDMSYDEAHDF